ncbi:hypothetical protein [Metabacillus bambusae]|uniref:Uncharacterized protein n=1 Tax=Metabacillus bambusae TaxID=2795218 RepID=A0ABS3N0V4_9BACI|nr:hypothetical protein [Metabacillus bambusae]MBO1511553.1 hypothetical protein [Metabacillus bambusae]
MINFHSPIQVWKSKNRIIVKIESIEVLLSVSSEKQPITFKRLEALLDGDKLPPFITYKQNEN